MNYNFFLLNESLNAGSIHELESGISNLNDILALKNIETDSFLKHDSIWLYNNGFGRVIDFYFTIVSLEIRRLVPIVFETFVDTPINIINEAIFDGNYPNDCNGFPGIDFRGLPISVPRQILSENSFKLFKSRCVIGIAYNSIQDFWDNRLILFPNLVFCDSIWGQIQMLSINDDRFKLIDAKLKKLNAFTGTWNERAFDYTRLGLDNSPDTPKRVNNTLALRTFNCPEIGERVFSLHIKWSFGRQFFRMYYFPEESNHKVYIGYIGPKDEIGF